MSAFTVVKGNGISDVDGISAFDDALLNAGIGNYNLVSVSSIIPGKSMRTNNIPIFEPGTILHCVIARKDIKYNEIGAVSLGYSISTKYGVVAEVAGTKQSETHERCLQILKEMTRSRCEEFETPIVETQEFICNNSRYACSVIVLVLLE
ncbi:pyruvoyl-dependent arginine decarboxylase [Chloroflexota bacterium]